MAAGTSMSGPQSTTGPWYGVLAWSLGHESEGPTFLAMFDTYPEALASSVQYSGSTGACSRVAKVIDLDNAPPKIEPTIPGPKKDLEARVASEAAVQPKKYQHAEAFCLMKYQCQKCGAIEILWNSRDGVTPFMIGCLKCPGMSQHINWRADVCRPAHVPQRGHRYFADETEANARSKVEKYIDDVSVGNGLPIPTGDARRLLADDLVRSWTANGAPCVLVKS